MSSTQFLEISKSETIFTEFSDVPKEQKAFSLNFQKFQRREGESILFPNLNKIFRNPTDRKDNQIVITDSFQNIKI